MTPLFDVVEDPLAEWNDGRFTLTAGDGAIAVERAAATDGLRVDDDSRALLSALFPPREASSGSSSEPTGKAPPGRNL